MSDKYEIPASEATLLDEFAARFAPAIWSQLGGTIDRYEAEDRTSELAYSLAAAMIRRRAKIFGTKKT